MNYRLSLLFLSTLSFSTCCWGQLKGSASRKRSAPLEDEPPVRRILKGNVDYCEVNPEKPAYYIMDINLMTSQMITCTDDEINIFGQVMEVALADYTLNAMQANGLQIPDITFVENQVCEVADYGLASSRARKLGFSFVYRSGGSCRLCFSDNSDGRRRQLQAIDSSSYCSDITITADKRLNLGCSQAFLCNSADVLMSEKKDIKCSTYNRCLDEKLDKWDDKKGCPNPCDNPTILMSEKGRKKCTSYDYCLDEKVNWEDKLKKGCSICNNPSVKDGDKEAHKCYYDVFKKKWLDREHWCFDAMADLDDKKDAGCDVCNDPNVSMKDKKDLKCSTYNICKDPEENCDKKLEKGCDICTENSVLMSDKGKYKCNNYDICLDEKVGVEDKIARKCEICYNSSIKEDDKLKNGCSAMFSVADIIAASLELTRAEQYERKNRVYLGEDISPEDSVDIVMEVIIPDDPDGLEIVIVDLENSKEVWKNDYEDNRKGEVVKNVLWAHKNREYKVTIEAPKRRGRGSSTAVVNVWLHQNYDATKDFPVLRDALDFKIERSHLMDLSDVTDTPFTAYIPALEGEVSSLLTRALENTYGQTKNSCLYKASPIVTVSMTPTTVGGANSVCNRPW